MLCKLQLLAISLFVSIIMFGQNDLNAIDGFKYAYVDVLVYQNNQIDVYGITAYLKNELSKKGLIVLDNNSNNWPDEAKLNPCLIGRWFPSHSQGSITNSAKGGYVIKNCKDEIVYESFSQASHFGYYYDKNVPLSIEKAFKPISSFNYKFDNSLTTKINYPTVEQTTETEETIRKYLSSNKTDPIEGIYKSYQNDQLSYYEIGIIKQDDKFKAIIIESDLSQWKPGEVKAVFQPSSMKGLYSVKWYMGNKTPYETFGDMDNDALLSIELKNVNTGEKRTEKFIKMFPSTSDETTFTNINTKVTGSGFFMTIDGIIATNAHVVENASKIEVTVSNEIGSFSYNAKTLLVDSKNDVALLQINDEKFKGLTSIPYGFIENSDVGSKVFTIGYPLNDVMGNNYKVTDGIISSQSGLADDVRYYQISVPLQPGNSGGPLFNKDGNIIGLTSARLNSEAVGVQVENVNYAIKSSYLLNLYNMLPNSSKLTTTSQVANKDLQDQVKTLKNYVCLINVIK